MFFLYSLWTFFLDVQLVEQIQECKGDEREHVLLLHDVHRRPTQHEDRKNSEVHGAAKVSWS